MLTEFKMGLIWQEHKEHGKLSSVVNSVRAVILPEDIEDLRAVTVIWTVGKTLSRDYSSAASESWDGWHHISIVAVLNRIKICEPNLN